MSASTDTMLVEWPVWTRISFRFGVVFGALALVPLVFDHIPRIGDWLEGHWYSLSERVADAFGRNLLGTGPIHHLFTGSGDTLYHYMNLLVVVLFALAGTIAWSILDRRRLAYPQLATAARIVLRYWLASFMLSYGLEKVFAMQFSPPRFARLYEPVGHMSPEGLLWTFMGASVPYQVFAGLLECLGGVLLLSRRTTLVGALVVATVMTNVVMLNLCYDVPVKLFSAELLGAAIVLLAPDLPRILALVRGRTVPAVMPPPQLPQRWAIAKLVAKVLVIGLMAYHPLDDLLVFRAAEPAPSSLTGAWQVDRFVRDGVDAPPLATDGKRWKLLVIGLYGAQMRTMDDRDRFVPIKKNAGAQLELGTLGFTVAHAGDRLVLTGTLDGHPTTIELHARDDSDMLLVHRGFHWIQEHPFIR